MFEIRNQEERTRHATETQERRKDFESTNTSILNNHTTTISEFKSNHQLRLKEINETWKNKLNRETIENQEHVITLSQEHELEKKKWSIAITQEREEKEKMISLNQEYVTEKNSASKVYADALSKYDLEIENQKTQIQKEMQSQIKEVSIQAKERHANGSTVVDIFIPPPYFQPVSLSFSRSPLSKIPKQVFFNPINIFNSFTHSITVL